MTDPDRNPNHHFIAPHDAASLYVGKVMHARLKPVQHRFSYDVFCLLMDLGRLEQANAASRLFSVNGRNLVSFHERDHGPGDNSSLKAYAERVLAEAGVDVSGGRVLLMCYPRIMGWVFNPISVYYAYDRAGALAGVIYEVRNTFGQRHTYVAPVAAGEFSEAGLRQSRRKRFYVSPFNGMEMEYHFRLRPPSAEIALRILENDAGGPMLSATFHGVHKGLTSQALVSALLRIPFLTAKVVGGIHWEALKLWIKGMRLVPRPPAPPPLSYGEGQATGHSERVQDAERVQDSDRHDRLRHDGTGRPLQMRT